MDNAAYVENTLIAYLATEASIGRLVVSGTRGLSLDA
jgi:hypothetical protein